MWSMFSSKSLALPLEMSSGMMLTIALRKMTMFMAVSKRAWLTTPTQNRRNMFSGGNNLRLFPWGKKRDSEEAPFSRLLMMTLKNETTKRLTHGRSSSTSITAMATHENKMMPSVTTCTSSSSLSVSTSTAKRYPAESTNTLQLLASCAIRSRNWRLCGRERETKSILPKITRLVTTHCSRGTGMKTLVHTIMSLRTTLTSSYQ
mmetsp:Transcript_57017/g.180451  ORF Transcript_57017/g.180451 Transcript_57017/m.180451 type:complete len:204 (-) Transcript_57017:3355-3966(-)